MFLPRDLGEGDDVWNLFTNTAWFDDNHFGENEKRPSMWVRYTDQEPVSYDADGNEIDGGEQCWKTDDSCNGGLLWTSWNYYWKIRMGAGYYPKGYILQNGDIDNMRYWAEGFNPNYTDFVHQPGTCFQITSCRILYAT